MNRYSVAALLTTALLGTAMATPVFAATTPGNVPFCASSTSQKDFSDGTYANLLQKKGFDLETVQSFNGCVQVTYRDGSGHVSIAYYDPDSLQLLETTNVHSNLG
ncbi:MAG: hypothetical protein ABI697_08945 [Devosia sp.]